MMNHIAKSALMALSFACLAASPPADFPGRILAAHNKERERVGVPPLTWSSDLARDAARWADQLARTRAFDHATAPADIRDEGENLWMGTAGRYPPEAMVGLWVAERSLFKPGKFPSVSNTGNWIDVGHYTQLIWRDSRQVGCALASNGADDYLVCRYSPPGNWEGEYPLGESRRPAPKPVVPKRKTKLLKNQ